MATKTKKTDPYYEPYDSLTKLHPAVWDHHKDNTNPIHFLQRTWQGNCIGMPGCTETVVLTQVYEWVAGHGRVYMTQWEHHPDQTGRLPFQHEAQWEYTVPTAREVWDEFVKTGAVRINP